MTTLFRRIKPLSFSLSIDSVAQFLGISRLMIVRVEKWAYVLFVHRRDRGGQFISYRKLILWMQAIISLIHQCNTPKEIQQLGLWIREECRRFQYREIDLQQLRIIWAKQRDKISRDVSITPLPLRN